MRVCELTGGVLDGPVEDCGTVEKVAVLKPGHGTIL